MQHKAPIYIHSSIFSNSDDAFTCSALRIEFNVEYSLYPLDSMKLNFGENSQILRENLHTNFECVYMLDRNLSYFLVLHTILSSIIVLVHADPPFFVKCHFGTLFMSFKHCMRKLLWNFNGKNFFLGLLFLFACFKILSCWILYIFCPHQQTEDLNFWRYFHVVSPSLLHAIHSPG